MSWGIGFSLLGAASREGAKLLKHLITTLEKLLNVVRALQVMCAGQREVGLFPTVVIRGEFMEKMLLGWALNTAYIKVRAVVH